MSDNSKKESSGVFNGLGIWTRIAQQCDSNSAAIKGGYFQTLERYNFRESFDNWIKDNCPDKAIKEICAILEKNQRKTLNLWKNGTHSPRIQPKPETRVIIFKLCFAMELNSEQTKKFFREVFFQSSMDFLRPEVTYKTDSKAIVNEIVFNYCIANDDKRCEGFEAACKLSSEISKYIKDVKAVSECEDNELAYTLAVKQDLSKLKNDEQLKDFVITLKKSGFFKRKNAQTARKNVKSFYNKIKDSPESWNKNSNFYNFLYGDNELECKENKDTNYKPYDMITADGRLNCLGNPNKDIAASEASKKINSNPLLKYITKGLPDAKNPTQQINGSASSDLVRKALILYHFVYCFGVRKEFDKQNYLVWINTILIESCLSPLCDYNPFDIVFIESVSSDNPLTYFHQNTAKIAECIFKATLE